MYAYQKGLLSGIELPDKGDPLFHGDHSAVPEHLAAVTGKDTGRPRKRIVLYRHEDGLVVLFQPVIQAQGNIVIDLVFTEAPMNRAGKPPPVAGINDDRGVPDIVIP